MSEFSESRRLLMRRTLENASLIPFYQEHWNEVLSGRDLQDLDLADFPMLDKSKYRERYMFDTRSLTEASLVTHTSGTSGELTWRHRTNIEAGVVATVFEKLLAHNAERPLVLSVQYGRHGMGMPMPSNCDVFPIALSDETELLQAIAATRTPFHIGGTPRFPTVLTGGVQHIALLAQARLDRGYGPETSSIKQIHCMGYCDPTIRNFVRYAFNEPRLVEDFSMAEVFGSSTREWPDAYFHSARHMFSEVISLQDGHRVNEGDVGELVLTELFPFTMMQPLIRYRTGDIVRCIKCSPEGEVSFQWFGRESDCPQLVSQTGKSEFAYFYQPFSDWLSLQPMIARASRQSYLPISSHDYGPPCFSHRIVDDGKRLAIDIGLNYNPWMHQSASRELAERIFAHISESCPAPDSARSRLELHFVHVRNEIDEASWIRSQPAFKIT